MYTYSKCLYSSKRMDLTIFVCFIGLKRKKRGSIQRNPFQQIIETASLFILFLQMVYIPHISTVSKKYAENCPQHYCFSCIK